MQKQNKDLHLRTFLQKKKMQYLEVERKKKRHAKTQMPKSNTS